MGCNKNGKTENKNIQNLEVKEGVGNKYSTLQSILLQNQGMEFIGIRDPPCKKVPPGFIKIIYII